MWGTRGGDGQTCTAGENRNCYEAKTTKFHLEDIFSSPPQPPPPPPPPSPSTEHPILMSYRLNEHSQPNIDTLSMLPMQH